LTEDPGSFQGQNPTDGGPVYQPLPRGPWYRFYVQRSRFYFGVVVFIVVVGLPMIVLPSLRNRLGSRLHTLRQAAAGSARESTVVAQVGQNPEPFPAQYQKQVATTVKPALPMIVLPQAGSQGAPQVVQAPAAVSPAPVLNPPRKRSLKLPTTPPGQSEAEPAAPSAAAARQDAEPDRQLEPEFRQGEMEKEAYGILLQWNPNVDQMVRGSNATLKFKSWAAAKRDEDTYWVRILFKSAADNSEVTYIWEVKITNKQVTPLNYNARLLPKP
jgi:hypothetical protein